MGWVRLDDKRAMNRKLRKVGFAARGLDEAAICQIAGDMTDGHIDRATVEMLAAAHGEKRWERLVAVLVEVGRWVPDGDGWQVHDYLEFNPSRAEWEAEIAKKRAAGRKSGEVRRASARTPVQAADPTPVGTPVQAPVPADVPTSDATNVRTDPTRKSLVKSVQVTHDPPDNPKPDRTSQLLHRWLDTCQPPNQRARHRLTLEAQPWIDHMLNHVDPAVIDQAIGRTIEAGQHPTTIRYLVAAVRDWTARNLPEVTIPNLDPARLVAPATTRSEETR